MGVKSTMELPRGAAVSLLRNLLKGNVSNEQLGDMLDVFHEFDNFLVSGPTVYGPVIPPHCNCEDSCQ